MINQNEFDGNNVSGLAIVSILLKKDPPEWMTDWDWPKNM